MADATAHNLADAHTEFVPVKGRKIAITGGTTGIGRAIAVLLASEGAKVFICGREEQPLADALARIHEVGGEGNGINVDLARKEEVERFFDAATGYLGGLDVAVINAAVPASGLAETDAEDIDYQLEVDLLGYVRSAKAAVSRMQAGADLVVIGSMSAVSQKPSSTVYVAAKAGVEGFVTALRKELAEKDIKVGLIEPGFTGSDFQYPEFPPEKQRELIHQHKMLRAEDIAVAAHFMLVQPRRFALSLMRVETRLNHP